MNAIVEIWQPDSNGVFRHPLDPRFAEADPGFFGWGRARTDADGRYRSERCCPGRSRDRRGARRPHANFMILAIGLTRRLVTTVFFDHPDAPLPDPVLDCVPDSSGARPYVRPARAGGSRTDLGIFPFFATMLLLAANWRRLFSWIEY